jgi:hypothetical protein
MQHPTIGIGKTFLPVSKRPRHPRGVKRRALWESGDRHRALSSAVDIAASIRQADLSI